MGCGGPGFFRKKKRVEPLIISPGRENHPISSLFPWRKGGFSSLQPDIFGCQMV